jgi:hypothetical protein
MTAVSDRPSDAGVNRNALWASTLIGVGGLLRVADAALSVATAIGAVRRRGARQLDEPPSQIARRQWSQAKAATSAGVEAWRHERHPTAVTRHASTIG